MPLSLSTLLPMTLRKLAELNSDVRLQEHQQRLVEEAEKAKKKNEPFRKLMLWSLGSGKSLGAISTAEALGGNYGAVVPAALRPNFQGEVAKFTDKGNEVPVRSYSEMALGKPMPPVDTLIADEAHRLRNPETAQGRVIAEEAAKAKNLLLLSGSPMVNGPQDLAAPVSMLTGKEITPGQFEARYVGTRKTYPNLLRRLVGWSSGEEPYVKNEDELKALLKGHVDWYDPGKPTVPTHTETVHTTMGVEQSRLYKAMWDQLPFWIRYKLRNDFPLSQSELMRMQSFLVGPRQVGLSTLPYLKNKDPLKAFGHSTKLQEAHKRMTEHLSDPRTKALVFANFIDAGLTPYAAALHKAGIPNAVFHGGLSDVERRKLVDSFNQGKIRVALLGPSGTEGLSFKGVTLTQLLDPHWSDVRGKQSIGRGLRFDSHFDSPEDLKNMKIERYVSRLPMGFKDRLLSGVGMDRTPNTYAADDHLVSMEKRKERLKQPFYELLRRLGTEKEQ